MRILIDECVPRPILKFLTGHNATTVQETGWGAYENGDLLRLAESSFDLFITADQNIRYQQNLAGRQIAIIELSTNHWGIIQANIALVINAVQTVQPAEYFELKLPSII